MNNLYKQIVTVLIWIIFISALCWAFSGCQYLAQIHYDTVIPDNEPIEVDTTPIDTPCIPQQYDQPQFVSGWWYIPFEVVGDVQVCVNGSCLIVPSGSNVKDELLILLDGYMPQLDYEVYVGGYHNQSVIFIAEGTNNKDLFKGKVWIRPVSVHSGWGFDCNTQAFFFFDALTFDEYMTKIDSLPSFDKFTLQYTNWDSLQYVECFNKILECRIGRSYADLRYLPFTFPDSVYTKFEDAGWDEVLY